MTKWRKTIYPNDLKFVSANTNVLEYFIRMFDLVYDKKIDTWDIQWVFNCFINSGLCITSSKNLITNIGIDGTHNSGNITDNHFLKGYDLNISKLKKLEFVYPSEKYDTKLHRQRTLKEIRNYKLKNFLLKIHLLDVAKMVRNILIK